MEPAATCGPAQLVNCMGTDSHRLYIGPLVFNGLANPTAGTNQLVFGDGSTTGNGRAEITAYTFNQIPEPSTALLLGLGLVGLAAKRRRIKKTG